MSFIALIDYGMGNLMSVSKALEAAGGKIRIVEKPAEAEGASGVVLPGVGNFGDGMEHLNRSGFVPFLKDAVRADLPFLGICLGLQILFEESQESPGVKGLGLLKGKILRLPKESGILLFPNCPELLWRLGCQSLPRSKPRSSRLLPQWHSYPQPYPPKQPRHF